VLGQGWERRRWRPRALVLISMSKPHVEALADAFNVRCEGHYFARAEPWEWQIGIFLCQLPLAGNSGLLRMPIFRNALTSG
jgi:hypothetical protein